jgi:hypothetical protein
MNLHLGVDLTQRVHVHVENLRVTRHGDLLYRTYRNGICRCPQRTKATRDKGSRREGAARNISMLLLHAGAVNLTLSAVGMQPHVLSINLASVSPAVVYRGPCLLSCLGQLLELDASKLSVEAHGPAPWSKAQLTGRRFELDHKMPFPADSEIIVWGSGHATELGDADGDAGGPVFGLRASNPCFTSG